MTAARTRGWSHGLGHAAFEFIESRWGKPGLRQFLFALRQTARTSGDPFASAFQITGVEFDQEFGRYLQERFTAEPSIGRTGSTMARPPVSRETSRRQRSRCGRARLHRVVGARRRDGTVNDGASSAAPSRRVTWCGPCDQAIASSSPARPRGNPRLRESSCEVWNGHPTDLPGPPVPVVEGGSWRPVRRSRPFQFSDCARTTASRLPGVGYSAWFSCLTKRKPVREYPRRS